MSWPRCEDVRKRMLAPQRHRAEGFDRLSPERALFVAPFALRYRRAGEARWLRYLSPNGGVGETPFALSLSKGSYRGDSRDEGFDRLSPNGPVRGSVRTELWARPRSP